MKEPDEYSPESVIGDEVDRILRIQALRNKLNKIEAERKPQYKDYSDITEDDLHFMSHITQ